jgi:FAD/FMN-containing dehydrogenase
MDGLAELRRAIAGAVVEPGAPDYDAARRPAMARFRHIRPRAVVRCAGAEDVASALAFARRSGLPVAPRGGGHCFAGRSSTDGIVLDLTPMRSISVAPAAVATIGAGARLADVYDALARHGLTLPAGCGAGVGIAGLTLGGGLGLLGRRYGLTCDRLRAARVVLTDGQIVDCDDDRHPDLFWALRGAGGGQFGVVTSLVFEAVPATAASRFVLTWGHAAAAAVIAAWQDWAPDAPDEVSANLMVVAAGTGAPVQAILFGAVLSTPAAAHALLDQLVMLSGARPSTASVTCMDYRTLKGSLDGLGMDEPAPAGAGPEPAGVAGRSEFVRRSLPAGVIADLLDALGHDRVPGEHRALNFTPMGGAYNRVPAHMTAFVHRTERFLLEHVATYADDRAAAPAWVRESHAIAHPWASGRVYPNFPDPDLTDWATAYHGGNHARLAEIKQAYDPDRILRFHQSL